MNFEMSQTFSTLNHSQMTSLNLLLSVRNYLRKSPFCWLNLHLQTSRFILSSESRKWHSADFNCLWQVPLKGMKRNTIFFTFISFHMPMIGHAIFSFSDLAISYNQLDCF